MRVEIKVPIWSGEKVGIAKRNLADKNGILEVEVLYKNKDGKRIFPHRYSMPNSVDSLNRLLGRLEQSDAPVIVNGEVGKKDKSFDTLVSFQLVQELLPREIWCPTCNNEYVPFKTISPDKGFSLCTQDESASRDYQDPRAFKQWQLNTPRFVSLLQKSLGIDGDAPKETLSCLLWDLGFFQTPTQKTHLFFVLDTARLGESGKAVLAQIENCLLIYAGTMRDLALKDFVSIPLNELVVGIAKKGLTLNNTLLNKHFPKTALVDSDGDIALDKALSYPVHRGDGHVPDLVYIPIKDFEATEIKIEVPKELTQDDKDRLAYMKSQGLA